MYSSISYNDSNNFLKASINFSISSYLCPANLLKGVKNKGVHCNSL